MEHDVHELIGKVAEQNGIRLDHDDPAFALVTLNEIVLKATADHLRQEGPVHGRWLLRFGPAS